VLNRTARRGRAAQQSKRRPGRRWPRHDRRRAATTYAGPIIWSCSSRTSPTTVAAARSWRAAARDELDDFRVIADNTRGLAGVAGMLISVAGVAMATRRAQ
jgi:hypothetical protein